MPLAHRLAELVTNHPPPEVQAALKIAVGAIRSRKDALGLKGEALEIEELCETLGLIANRRSHPLSYISRAGGMNGNEVVVPGLASAGLPALEADDLEKQFEQARQYILGKVLEFTRVAPAQDVSYLHPLLKERGEPVWIATLNYDDSIEMAADAAGLPVNFGIAEHAITLNRAGEPGSVTLAKLHGSVNWVVDREGSVLVRPDPPPVKSTPGVIFGAGNKLRVEGPYLDLLLAFRDRLTVTDTLHICGYSFRDEHINHLILTWIIAEGRQVFVHNPSFGEGMDLHKQLQAHARALQMQDYLSTRRPAYSRLIQKSVFDRRGAAEWLASLD